MAKRGTWQAEVSLAPEQHSYTKRFARYGVELARCMTPWDVAYHLEVSWNLVKTILKEELRRRFRRTRLKDLRWLAIDRSQAYLRAVAEHLPDAVLVFDHFQVVKLMNDKLSDLRRELQRQAEEEQKTVLQGSRWLLVENPENLREDNDEASPLREALALNAPLATAYYLK